MCLLTDEELLEVQFTYSDLSETDFFEPYKKVQVDFDYKDFSYCGEGLMVIQKSSGRHYIIVDHNNFRAVYYVNYIYVENGYFTLSDTGIVPFD